MLSRVLLIDIGEGVRSTWPIGVIGDLSERDIGVIGDLSIRNKGVIGDLSSREEEGIGEPFRDICPCLMLGEIRPVKEGDFGGTAGGISSRPCRLDDEPVECKPGSVYGLSMGDNGLNVLTGTATSSLGRSILCLCDLCRISSRSKDALAAPWY